MTLKFSEIKDRIQESLQEKLPLASINEKDGFSLLEGFLLLPIQQEIGGDIGGPSIPMIGIVGNTTGRIYYFALKRLLPDVSI